MMQIVSFTAMIRRSKSHSRLNHHFIVFNIEKDKIKEPKFEIKTKTGFCCSPEQEMKPATKGDRKDATAFWVY